MGSRIHSRFRPQEAKVSFPTLPGFPTGGRPAPVGPNITVFAQLLMAKTLLSSGLRLISSSPFDQKSGWQTAFLFDPTAFPGLASPNGASWETFRGQMNGRSQWANDSAKMLTDMTFSPVRDWRVQYDLTRHSR